MLPRRFYSNIRFPVMQCIRVYAKRIVAGKIYHFVCVQVFSRTPDNYCFPPIIMSAGRFHCSVFYVSNITRHYAMENPKDIDRLVIQDYIPEGRYEFCVFWLCQKFLLVSMLQGSDPDAHLRSLPLLRRRNILRNLSPNLFSRTSKRNHLCKIEEMRVRTAPHQGLLEFFSPHPRRCHNLLMI